MELTKKTVINLLIAFHIVTFGAVFLRIDTFPLTWVPMYSQFHGQDELVVTIGDRERTKKGFEVTTASGNIEFIAREDLNIPKNAFRRIYYQRAFGKGPPKHRRERANLNPVSDAIFDLWYEDPATSIDWSSRILNMMNVTLNRAPSDPDYIVKAVAVSKFAVLSREQRRQGDFSNLNVETRTAVVEASPEKNGGAE